MSGIPHVSGLREIAESFDTFLLDIFGLLHNGVELYPGTIEALRELNAANKEICLVSNTPRLPDEVAADLHRLGLERTLYQHIATAGLAAQEDLHLNHQGTKIWFTGKDNFVSFMSDCNLVRVDDPADADLIINAIAGMTAENDTVIYDNLSRALQFGKPMLCANPDMVVHIGPDSFICAGTYAAWYENQGGKVTYHGKPHPSVYEIALGLVGDPGHICAMGDALHTDIQGANRMGFSSIWVLSGIHWEELRLSAQPAQPDLDRVAETLTISPYKPTATLTQLCW